MPNFVQELKHENAELKIQLGNAQTETRILKNYIVSSDDEGNVSMWLSQEEIKMFVGRIAVALNLK